jgi:glycosyltransferase involved in cell wall biosynthesis
MSSIERSFQTCREVAAPNARRKHSWLRRPRLANSAPQVAIVVAYLSHFRAPFYQALRTELQNRNIELRLLYGITEGHWSRELEWAEPFRTRMLPGGATWFPVFSRLIRTADLVISEDASRHLFNYAILAARKLARPRLVVWGHGWDHQTSRPRSLSERLKMFVGRRADGFFAYTPGIRLQLIARGYAEARVHDVLNTIPAPAARPEIQEVEKLRADLNLQPDAQIALYCGRIYSLKRLELLIEAAELVKAALPGFELIIAGAGPSQSVAENASKAHSHVHYVGPVFGSEKARYFAISDVCVIPGMVGLALVDAFHHRVPPIVTRMDIHSPEIEYLRHEVNGLMTEHRASDLAEAMVRVLQDQDLQHRLVAGCEASSAYLSIDNMVARFVTGILSTLEANKAQRRLSYE